MICKQCSKCCRLIVVRIGERVDDDYIKWAGYHGLEIVMIKNIPYLKLNKKCRHLKNDKCQIQDEKPELCKNFNCEDYKEFKFLL